MNIWKHFSFLVILIIREGRWDEMFEQYWRKENICIEDERNEPEKEDILLSNKRHSSKTGTPQSK